MDRPDLLVRLLEQQRNKCFICGKAIDLALDKVEVDHVIPRAKGGKDDENNYAATHEVCNRNKSDSDLRIARCMATYDRLKQAHEAEGPNRPNLGDFLADADFHGARFSLHARVESESLVYSMPELGAAHHQTPIFEDKLSSLRSVFLTLPLEYLHHDQRINPRAVGPRVRGLLNEFLSKRPQLHIALAWGDLEGDLLRVHVFDGQHKAVAQILLGARTLPIRLFINPDLNLLLEANTNAGTVLRQVAFDQATQRFLGSQLYWEKIDTFRQATGRQPDDISFSEQDLLNYFRGERREVTRYILDDVRIGIIHHPDNKLKDYVEFSGREGEKPLSYSTIEKTAFSLFIRKTPLSLPIGFKVEVGENPRQLEKDQVVRLFNILAKFIYVSSYDFDIGANKVEERLRKSEPISESHLRAVRLSREEVFYNVLRYVRELVKQYFLMRGQVIEDSELFQNKFSEELWSLIEKLIGNICQLPLWANKQLSATVFGGKQTHEYWKVIFDTGRDPAGTAVLARALNLNELIR